MVEVVLPVQAVDGMDPGAELRRVSRIVESLAVKCEFPEIAEVARTVRALVSGAAPADEAHAWEVVTRFECDYPFFFIVPDGVRPRTMWRKFCGSTLVQRGEQALNLKAGAAACYVTLVIVDDTLYVVLKCDAIVMSKGNLEASNPNELFPGLVVSGGFTSPLGTLMYPTWRRDAEPVRQGLKS